MRTLLLFAFAALLAIAACSPSLCLADTVEICNATVSAGGDTSSIPCAGTSSGSIGLFFASGQQLSVELLDFATGSVSTNVPGAELSVYLDWEVSMSGDFEVSGGSGNGELVLTGFSDSGDFSGDPFGVPLSGEFTSNFLPPPAPYPGYGGPGNPILIPFTFGVPFNLNADAVITGGGSGSSGFLDWNAIWQVDLVSNEILDSNGNPVADASISSVPEPSTIITTALMLFGICGALRRKAWDETGGTKPVTDGPFTPRIIRRPPYFSSMK